MDSDTPDMYIEDGGGANYNGAIRALTADGRQKWVWPTSPVEAFPLLLAGDNAGGAIYIATDENEDDYLGRLDPEGNEDWQHSLATSGIKDYAIHPDGTIFLVQPSYDEDGDAVVGLNPDTGGVEFAITVPKGTTVNLSTCFTSYNQQPGFLSIDSSGTVYFTFVRWDSNIDCMSSPLETTLELMEIQSNGSYTTRIIDSVENTSIFDLPFGWYPGTRAVPDGQGEVFLPTALKLYHTSGSGASSVDLPVWAGMPWFSGFGSTSGYNGDPMLLGEDGTAYIVGSNNESYNPNPPNASSNPYGELHKVDTLFAIDTATGDVDWTWTSPEGADGIVPFLVTADGKVAFHYDEGSAVGRLAMVDSEGEESPLLAAPDGSDVGPQPWFGVGQFGASFMYGTSTLTLLPGGEFASLASQTPNVSGTDRAVASGTPQRSSGPWRCPFDKCAVAPIGDDIAPGEHLVTRTITYGVFQVINGVLIPLHSSPDSPDILLQEQGDLQTTSLCPFPGCRTKYPQEAHGTIVDLIQRGIGATQTERVRQTFYIDNFRVRIYWRYPYNNNGFIDYSWFGSWAQEQTVPGGYYLYGAHIRQEDPDFAQGVDCQSGPLGCSTIGPSGRE